MPCRFSVKKHGCFAMFSPRHVGTCRLLDSISNAKRLACGAKMCNLHDVRNNNFFNFRIDRVDKHTIER